VHPPTLKVTQNLAQARSEPPSKKQGGRKGRQVARARQRASASPRSPSNAPTTPRQGVEEAEGTPAQSNQPPPSAQALVAPPTQVPRGGTVQKGPNGPLDGTESQEERDRITKEAWDSLVIEVRLMVGAKCIWAGPLETTGWDYDEVMDSNCARADEWCRRKGQKAVPPLFGPIFEIHCKGHKVPFKTQVSNNKHY
jgi:hypothetical protein